MNMPLLRVTYQRGTITHEQKLKLAEGLTPVLVAGEVGVDNPAGRKGAHILFHEMDTKTEWFVGGKPDTNAPAGGRLILEMLYVEGAASQSEKSIVHAKMNEIIGEVLGVDGSFPGRALDWWVIIREVSDGDWGASGQTVGVRQANTLLGGAPERAGYFEQVLAAKKRQLAAHGYPVERA
jgi:phenylpyruvate tautomerase PptA (4-oxalocrotonate tautomerase family)